MWSHDPLEADLRTRTWSAGITQLLPLRTQVGVELTGARNRFDPGDASRLTQHGSGLTVSASQPLLDGLNLAGLDARVAAADHDAALSNARRVEAELAAGVALAYWSLAEAEAEEAVLLRSLEDARALLFRNRELAERDVVAEVDVLTAESGMELRRALHIEAARLRRDAAEALVFLVYGNGAADVLVADTLPVRTADQPDPPPALPDPAAAIAIGLDRRADLIAIRHEARGSDILLSAARRSAWPGIDLIGSLTTAGQATRFGDAFDQLDDDVNWSVGIRFSQPIGNRRDGGARDLARWRTELDAARVAAAENLVRSDVRLAVRAVHSHRERMTAAQRASQLATLQLGAERRRLDLGLGDSFRLLETEENAVQAELALVRARYDLARAMTLYRLATGALQAP